MRLKITLFVLLSTSFLFSQYSTINDLINKTKNDDALYGAQWGVYARYVEGEPIIALNENFNLAPASGLKVFTSSFALNSLGEDYKFLTKIYYDGKISNGILDGNIYIKGSGDPTLGSNLVKSSSTLNELMQHWSNAIKSAGINKVNGNIYGDDLLFENNLVPDYWPWTDIGNYYGAAPSALTINDNLYYLYFKPGKVNDAAKVIRTDPLIPNLKFENFMQTGKDGSGDNGYIFNAPNSYNAVLRGTIPAGVDEFSIKGSIPNPAWFAAYSLFTKLNQSEINVSGEPKTLASPMKYDEQKLLTSTYSPPLKDVVFIINKKSNNLYTELILKAAALKETGLAGTNEGIESLKKFLLSNGINTNGLDLYDGSGLSRTNTITAKMMAELLSFMTTTKVFDSFYNSLAVAGIPDDEGLFTSYGKGTAIAGNARIKSGFITGVRSHSGYVRDKKGRLIAFSFIANNYPGLTSKINELHKQIIIALAGIE
ncbi:MAG: D-alanyl-D-alanine carboxypeptidase/D-alanyl-D-alanine-endopeptidase [Ignavibacteriaceae bacterium]|nr:D-alanyl-D-alanine carboxypeptidase/D-alanyl-D-alanine-endopeptidase [Ignavibacteriaceae bacterium]